ncbi:radical SAM protein [Archaeoglobus sp.]
MTEIEQLTRFYEQIEGHLMPFKVNLSITNKCTWRCVFCYKGCPKNSEMDSESLRIALDRITAEPTITVVGLTGGEPTTHPMWRETATFLTKLGRKVSLLTNCSGITEDDIDLLPEITNSIQISIHGTGEGAEKITGSKVQKGLEVLEALTHNSEEDYHIKTITMVMKSNVGEVIPLLERLERIWEETGKPDEIKIALPDLLCGSLVKNADLYLTKEEWMRLKRGD